MSMYKSKIQEIDQLQEEINSYRPLKKRELQELKEYYRIGLTYTSNALEGNSLTETETKIVLEEGITIGGKLIKDHLETIGHSDAYDLLYKLEKKDEIKEKDILNLHKLFYFRIDPKQAGKYRKEQVFITGTDFVPPLATLVPHQMREFVADMPTLQQSNHPAEYAALIHLQLVTIHPFVDGNGRTARLLMNLALLQAGYVIAVIPPVVRRDYIDAIKKAQVSNDNGPFINFISNMICESQRDYLRLVSRLQQK